MDKSKAGGATPARLHRPQESEDTTEGRTRVTAQSLKEDNLDGTLPSEGPYDWHHRNRGGTKEEGTKKRTAIGSKANHIFCTWGGKQKNVWNR